MRLRARSLGPSILLSLLPLAPACDDAGSGPRADGGNTFEMCAMGQAAP